ncbi:MAG: hypothetical protein KBC83_02820 [Candidatus Moranbacteria bacterium]|jgi:hypothetical protein|nr:hypothetical protein [Candidatus Moranbacteria bacterium]MBP9801571.1 hypothetical protein [Candidatus Moranbacteria bacterium]
MPEELRSIRDNMDSNENGEGISASQEQGDLVVENVEREGTPEKKQETEANQLAEILSKTAPVLGTAGSTGSATDDARNLSLLADIESQVTRLMDLATQKGIPHAVHVAQKMKNYYLLDRMHDEMVDKFYQGLIEKGLVEKAP